MITRIVRVEQNFYAQVWCWFEWNYIQDNLTLRECKNFCEVDSYAKAEERLEEYAKMRARTKPVIMKNANWLGIFGFKPRKAKPRYRVRSYRNKYYLEMYRDGEWEARDNSDDFWWGTDMDYIRNHALVNSPEKARDLIKNIPDDDSNIVEEIY